jgi:rhodanese-related sulfurtransferase
MKTFLTIIIFNLLFFSSVTGQGADSVKFKSLLPYYFHLTYLKDDNAILIDVREFFEFRRVRIKDAVNIPSSANLEVAADTIDKQCGLFLYCTTGYRSKKVARYFYDKGFVNLFSLDGGIMAWKKDGFPVERNRLRTRDSRRRKERL